MFTGTTDVKAETPILWPTDEKSLLLWKDPDAGKYWGQEEKGTTEDEMAGWHHRLDGHEFEWTPGVGDGQRGLVCCGSWDHKELDTTEQLNWTELEFSSTNFKGKDICQGMFNFKESNMLHFSSFVCHFSRILCSLSVPIPGTSTAACSSQDWDHGKGYLLRFLSVTPFSDSFQHQQPCMY